MSVTDTEPGRSAGRRTTKKLLIAVACGFLVAVIGLGVLILPDQFCSVQAPPDGNWVWEGLNRQPSAGNIETADLTRPEIGSPEVRVDPGKPDDDVNGRNGSAVPLISEDALKKCRPFPDLSKLPEDARGAAEKLNGKMDAGIKKMLAFLEDRERKYWEVWIEVQNISNRECGDVFRECFDLKNARPEFASQYCRYEIVNRVLLSLSLRDEEWLQAAGHCADLAYPSDLDPHSSDDGKYRAAIPKDAVPNVNSVWWGREVYYLRKAGFGGRIQLAGRSFSRFAVPIARTVEYSFISATESITSIANGGKKH